MTAAAPSKAAILSVLNNALTMKYSQLIPHKLKLTIWLIGLAQLCGAQVYFLNGDAQATGDDCYALTSELNYQNGTVWYGEQVDLLQPFAIQFRMNFGALDGSGADGICFVLQTVGTSAIGINGGGMGYLNFGTSLGIEFDTWQNGEYNDPGYDHIAIERNGDIDHNSSNQIAGPVQADVFDQNIEDGADHVVRIEWDPVLERIRVYFDCVFRLQGNVDIVNTIFGGNSLVYWGFTAATGGAYNNQSVCLQPNILNVGNEIVICEGMQPTLGVGSSIDGVYAWSPPDFLSDPTSPTPVTTTPSDITYTVTYVDLCGDSITQDVFVNVETLAVTASPQDILNCDNSEVVVGMESNIPLQTAFAVTDANGLIVAQNNNIATWIATEAGEYQITASIDGVCASEVSITIEEDFTLLQLDAGSDIQLDCNTSNSVTDASSDGVGVTYNWIYNGAAVSNDNTLQLPIASAGTYLLTAVHPTSACWSIDTLLVTADFQEPTIAIPEQDTLTCLHPVVEISDAIVNAAHSYNVFWTHETGASIVAASTLSPQVSEPGVYTVEAIDEDNGCRQTASIEVFADDLEPIQSNRLRFPNVISPNQDGQNAVWRVFLLDDAELAQDAIFKEYELVVRDRWGKEVASCTSPNQFWNASEVAEGVFFYTLTYTLLCGDGEPTRVEGYVHVMR
jgi:hypothetical protein